MQIEQRRYLSRLAEVDPEEEEDEEAAEGSLKPREVKVARDSLCLPFSFAREVDGDEVEGDMHGEDSEEEGDIVGLEGERERVGAEVDEEGGEVGEMGEVGDVEEEDEEEEDDDGEVGDARGEVGRRRGS